MVWYHHYGRCPSVFAPPPPPPPGDKLSVACPQGAKYAGRGGGGGVKYEMTPTIISKQNTAKSAFSETRREQCSIINHLNDVVSDLKEMDEQIID